ARGLDLTRQLSSRKSTKMAGISARHFFCFHVTLGFIFAELHLRFFRLVKPLLHLLPFVALLMVLFAFAQPHGQIPALARFLEPHTGAWHPPDDELKAWDNTLHLDGLKGAVVVHFDQNRIPHVFADSDEDLYFAQG